MTRNINSRKSNSIYLIKFTRDCGLKIEVVELITETCKHFTMDKLLDEIFLMVGRNVQNKILLCLT